MFKVVKFLKDFLFFFPITLIVHPFTRLFLFLSHFNPLILWIRRNKNGLIYSDFYSPVRDYTKRYLLYGAVSKHYALQDNPVMYMEFGVSKGSSFKWWINNCQNKESRFFGFDTFEGLPEDWGGFFKKGDMHADLPTIDDARGAFLKGLFQQTLPPFVDENKALLKSDVRKIIHLDADLYTATIFTLSQLYPYIKKGDLIFFDEFNVALHEYKAFAEFTSAFYVQLKPIGAVNNFYQTAFVVE